MSHSTTKNGTVHSTPLEEEEEVMANFAYFGNPLTGRTVVRSCDTSTQRDVAVTHEIVLQTPTPYTTHHVDC